MDTYPLIVLMKLDFPAPESPVIAMSTFTSCHLSILLLKYFTMEPGLRRPFFSTSFWKSCTHFDSQFIAKGRLETERYTNESGPQQRQGFIMLRPVHVTRIFDPSACAWVYYSHTQRGAGEWWSPKSRPFGWGKNKLHGFDPLFLLCCKQERTKKGEFHISHDASLHTMLSSFRTHVILSVQQGRDSWTTAGSDLFCR